MMGERDGKKQLWNYQVKLDKRVRSDHALRRINETLELDFVRREVAKFYGTKGNVSEDPVVIMKMMLLLFLDNVRSERELMRIIPERLDYMWFLVKFPQRYQNSHRIFRNLLCSKNFRQFCGSQNRVLGRSV